MGQTFWDTRAYAGEDVLSVAPRTGWVETGGCANRKTRRLCCLNLHFRKPSQDFPSNWVPKHSPTNEVSQMDFVHSRRPRRDGIREVKEEFGHSSSPVMNVIKNLKSWLLSSRYERPRKVHHDPFASYARSSVIPIHTGASILQYQSPSPPANVSGATTREPATARNSRLSPGLSDELFEPASNYQPSYQRIDPRFNLLGQTLCQHIESGVNLETRRSSLEDNEGMNVIVRKGTFEQSFQKFTTLIRAYRSFCMSAA